MSVFEDWLKSGPALSAAAILESAVVEVQKNTYYCIENEIVYADLAANKGYLCRAVSISLFPLAHKQKTWP